MHCWGIGLPGTQWKTWMNSITNAQWSSAVCLILPQEKNQLEAQCVTQLKKRYISVCCVMKSVLWPYTHVLSLLKSLTSFIFFQLQTTHLKPVLWILWSHKCAIKIHCTLYLESLKCSTLEFSGGFIFPKVYQAMFSVVLTRTNSLRCIGGTSVNGLLLD